MVDDRLVPLLRDRQPAEDVVEERPDVLHPLGGAVGEEEHAVEGLVHGVVWAGGGGGSVVAPRL